MILIYNNINIINNNLNKYINLRSTSTLAQHPPQKIPTEKLGIFL